MFGSSMEVKLVMARCFQELLIIAVDKVVRTLTNTQKKYAYGTLREQKFRSPEVCLRHAARTGVEKCNKKVAIPLIIL
jgi:hypothetical protein